MDELAELKKRVAALEGEGLGPVLQPLPYAHASAFGLIDRLCARDPTIGLKPSIREDKAALAQAQLASRRVCRLAVVKDRLAYLKRPTFQEQTKKELAEISSLEAELAELSDG
jgi:hypothetical protein